MADYTNSIGQAVSLAPDGAVATPWGRLETLITPEQLRTRVLLGIPLVLKTIDPITKRATVITDPILKDFIRLALNRAETVSGLTLMPTQFSEKLPYDKRDWDQLGYFQLAKKPAVSVESMTVELADGTVVFNIPLNWLETANMMTGQLNLIPLFSSQIAAQVSQGSNGITGTGAGAFFNSLIDRSWVAALIRVKYTAGFQNGLLPSDINELVGVIAGLRVLSMLGAAHARTTSQSLSVDGISQSVNTPGPQLYKQRIDELTAERNEILSRIKGVYGGGICVTSI